MSGLREWYRNYRALKKAKRFTQFAAARGLVTARLSQPTPLRHGRVLVLAPHVDDEAIGCGGTLLLHRQAGDPVHVVYVLADVQRQEAREQEGNNVGALLSARITHLRCPQHVEAVRDALTPLLVQERPDVIYVPWWLDNHEGHMVVNVAAGQVLEAGLNCGELWCYEVWTPLIPNRIVDITSVLDQKTRLFEQYTSQIAYKDVASMAVGLSRYRGGLLANKTSVAAEVFLALSATEYQACTRYVFKPR